MMDISRSVAFASMALPMAFLGIRVGNAYGDGQAALGISIHQKYALALTGQPYTQIHCGGCLTDAALLVGHGDDFAVVHLFALLCDEKKPPSNEGGE
jgi:hypothetical protein